MKSNNVRFERTKLVYMYYPHLRSFVPCANPQIKMIIAKKQKTKQSFFIFSTYVFLAYLFKYNDICVLWTLILKLLLFQLQNSLYKWDSKKRTLRRQLLAKCLGCGRRWNASRISGRWALLSDCLRFLVSFLAQPLLLAHTYAYP